MNIKRLKEKLEQIGIHRNEYSLYGELQSDSIILFESYSNWIVFYLDERGERHDERTFGSEKKACEYIYFLFEESLKNRKKGF